MLRRYPHTGEMIIKTEVKVPGGIPDVQERSFEIQGRFEPGASRNAGIDYRAKFFCRNVDYVISIFLEAGLFPEDLIDHSGTSEMVPFTLDGQTFRWEGKDFEVVMLHNYQTHCEIWLE